MPWQNTQGNKNEQDHPQPFFLSKRFMTRLHALALTLATEMHGLEDSFRQRYASLLLYRLLFMHFLQRLGLLAGDTRYLQRRLEHGGFYRGFLRPLFREGRFPDLARLPLSQLFSSREIEDAHPAIEIADEPFRQLLELFDEYLTLEGRRTRGAQAALMAELLGEVCEQHEHSRETGTYYTPRVVTSYIVRNTLPLALVTRTRALCPAPGLLEELIWQTLVSEPLRYIYPATLQGYAEPLPPEIAAGLTDVTRRASWQQGAPPTYAHPGESWREVLRRRARVDEILNWTRQETPVPLERLVTWNINMPALLLHTLRTCQRAEVLSACYESVRQLSVLDPTCGTGAFLCAAIPFLQDLYTVCLARMEAWCADPGSEHPLTLAQRGKFAAWLAEAGPSSERASQILQWIIAHNLYGVDLHEEAVEVCRLRLYLKLLAASPTGQPPALAQTFAAHLHVGNSLLGSLDRAPCREQGPSAAVHMAARPSRYQQALHWGRVFPVPLARGGFDVVIGNPPYIEYERVRPLYQVEGYATLETGNLYALTMERALHLLAPGGRFGMIVPASATCTQGYRTLQKLLLAQQELHVASFSDQRGHLFALS
ncbi:MAG TPA: Eco57I restriction-modification methylase domain-containing protein, partial [Ktedonobacteraceae bacterium]|nr:Eco57I restriction-modification methylase domain-containing protein [Ktedonobacteraceae bacterium]